MIRRIESIHKNKQTKFAKWQEKKNIATVYKSFVEQSGKSNSFQWCSACVLCLISRFGILLEISTINRTLVRWKATKSYLFMNNFRCLSNQTIEIKSQRFLELIFNHFEHGFWLNYDYLMKMNEKCFTARDIQCQLLEFQSIELEPSMFDFILYFSILNGFHRIYSHEKTKIESHSSMKSIVQFVDKKKRKSIN